MRIIRYAAWAAIAALAVAGGLLYAFGVEPDKAGTRMAASIGGPFTLTTQEGKRLSSAELKGKPFAIFFGFTYCPEICPTTLLELTQTIQQMGEEADKMRFFFVTIDPERDTPEQLKLYLSSFDPRITGLTGTAEEIAAVAEAYRVYYRKVPADGDYTMEHTALIYLMDESGGLDGVLALGVPPETRLEKLKSLVGAS